MLLLFLNFGAHSLMSVQPNSMRSALRQFTSTCKWLPASFLSCIPQAVRHALLGGLILSESRNHSGTRPVPVGLGGSDVDLNVLMVCLLATVC